MSDHGPDLVARAAARLGRAIPPRSTEALVSTPPVARSSVAESAVGLSSKSQPTPENRGKVITIDRVALARTGALIAGGARTRTSEEFQIIKRQIVSNAQRRPKIEAGERSGRLIMVTSTKPREGKTFAAVNLGLSLASEQDLRVLLVDLDVHHKSLSGLFGVSAEPGWVDMLADGTMGFADVLLRTNIPNLELLAAGRTSQNVPELLSSKRAAGLLAELAQRYANRFIILDAPPCLASSEPSILAGLVGQIIFVVEAHKTEREEIESALRLLSDCANISLLLNKADARNQEEFGSYSAYRTPEGLPG